MAAAACTTGLNTSLAKVIGNFPVDENYLPYTKENETANRKTFS
jgi:hypothetical protein